MVEGYCGAKAVVESMLRKMQKKEEYSWEQSQAVDLKQQYQLMVSDSAFILKGNSVSQLPGFYQLSQDEK